MMRLINWVISKFGKMDAENGPIPDQSKGLKSTVYLNQILTRTTLACGTAEITVREMSVKMIKDEERRKFLLRRCYPAAVQKSVVDHVSVLGLERIACEDSQFYVGEKLFFEVFLSNCKHLDPEKFFVDIFGNGATNLGYRIQKRKEVGTAFLFAVRFNEAGYYLMSLRYVDITFKDSPYKLKVSNRTIGGPTCGLNSEKIIASGDGLNEGNCYGEDISFRVATKRFRDPRRSYERDQDLNLEILIDCPNGQTMSPGKKEASRSGTEVHYWPFMAGTYWINVTWVKKHISGSPFKVEIMDRKDDASGTPNLPPYRLKFEEDEPSSVVIYEDAANGTRKARFVGAGYNRCALDSMKFAQ